MTRSWLQSVLAACALCAAPSVALGQDVGGVATPAPSGASAGETIGAADADDPTAGLPNPFEGVEAWRLPNGMLVYFKNLPKAEEVFLRATLPVGSRQDPDGLEGLAHFVEHMMFTGPDGMSKAEFQQLVEDRGGSTNASTNRDRTDYWVKLPASEWEFGLEWFEDLLFGHEFVDEHVQEERRAVILERDLEPATPLDLLEEHVLDPDWADAPGFWERQLGVPTERNSTMGTWEEIQAATRDDLQAFHDRWYGPQNMTLAVFGPLDRDAVAGIVERRFGAVQTFGETVATFEPARHDNRPRTAHSFEQRGGHEHSVYHVLRDVEPEDWAWGLFLRGLLREHLNDVLRRERRAAYGVSVSLGDHRGHGYLAITGNFEEPQEEEARAYVESMLDQLSAGTFDPALFEKLRRRVVAPFLLENQEPSRLAGWVEDYLYARDVHGEEFPDPVTFARAASADGLAEWMQRRLGEETRVVVVKRPSPLWPLAEVALVIVAIVVAFLLARRVLIRPLDMTTLRYVRKIRHGFVPTALGIAAFFLALVVLAHVVSIATRRIFWMIIDPIDSYVVHFAASLAAVMVITALIVLLPASIPRKVLLLEDHWRIKAISYRSRVFRYDETTQVRRRHLVGALLDVRLWPVRILHWGIFRRGIHLKAGRGSWFFHTRDDAELVSQLVARGAEPAGGDAEAGGAELEPTGAAGSAP